MADISSQLLLFVDGKLQKIGADGTIAQSRINGLTSALSTLTTDVGAAQSDATQALSNAAAAQSTANSAASAASAAQSDATQALADAAGAQSTANSAVTAAAAAQTDATQALADAAGAQGTANSAVTAAAAAQTDATQALADAAAAQSTANGAVTDAAAAQSTANSALSAANAAQTDATQALSDAAAAQSTANSAQSDATSALGAAAAAQTDATQALADAAAAQSTANAALPATGPQTFSGDLTITGDLTVQGEVYSKVPTTVLVGDSFLDLNAGNTVSASASPGGFTVNVKASGALLIAPSFVAGVESVSAPYFTTTASTLISGDIVQIAGSFDAKNDGLFIVGPGSGSTTVYIKGIGGTSVDQSKTPFAKNQFVAQTSQSATVTKVDLAVFSASNGLMSDAVGPISAGTFCYKYAAAATESAFSQWVAITTASIPTLEQVLASGSMLGDVDKVGYELMVAANTAAGSIIYIDSAGVCQKLSSSVSGGELEGVTLAQSDSGSNSIEKVATLLGQKLLIKAKSGDEPSPGDLVYVSSVAGSVGKTVPSSGRIIKVGRCVDSAVGGLYPVIYLPQYIADV
jgi:multidrug efflux pump subunit AcrA (membrane-fusion protein)